MEARSEDLLSNLRCPTLSHYKLYKDVFFSRLLSREDSHLDYWKAKFISGLLHLFVEKVRIRLKNKHGGTIQYSAYTLGELLAEICAEGLALCTDMKLKKQLDKQNLTGKKELGDFCQQFGYHIEQSKDKTHKHQHKKYRPEKKERKLYKRKKKEKYIKKFLPKDQYRKGKRKITICYKCGKVGHYKNTCKIKKKLNAIILDENIRNQIYDIIQLNKEESTSSSENNSSSDISLIGQIEDENIIISNSSDMECSCSMPSCNMLSKEDSLILDIIDKINNPDEKREILTQFINLAKSKTKNTLLIKPPDEYNFADIMKRMSQKETMQKEPTIAELKQEVNEVKIEINHLKNRIKILELQNEVNGEITDSDEIEFTQLVDIPETSGTKIEEIDTNISVNIINKVITQKWFVIVKIIINQEYEFHSIALIDS
ncbi:hypothetical protein AMTRI_Chr01g131490 [Amborella trichopoda]